jgi:1-acyl-sn-glycerol-3-phosphate acyltransferase
MSMYVPQLGDRVPQRTGPLLRAFGRVAMRAGGWRLEGAIPNLPKLMFVVAPHTSNWDFVIAILAVFAMGLRPTFLGKHTLFRWPLGLLMRWLGGVPVFRHAPRNVVDQTVDHINRVDKVALGLSPEGTRKKLAAWRTGFHYVARGAGIPIVPVALDYSTRTVRFFPIYQPADTVEADVAALGPLFSAGMARYPAQY